MMKIISLSENEKQNKNNNNQKNSLVWAKLIYECPSLPR